MVNFNFIAMVKYKTKNQFLAPNGNYLGIRTVTYDGGGSVNHDVNLNLVFGTEYKSEFLVWPDTTKG
jgi:hypothetical protein